MYKILFTDMDGTLLDSEKQISAHMKAVIWRMVEGGGRLVLSSGRALSSILQSAKSAELLFPGTLIIAGNGNEVYDYDNDRYLLRKFVPRELGAEIVALADEMGIYIQAYDEGTVLARQNAPELEYYLKMTRMEARFVEDLMHGGSNPSVKLLAMSMEDHRALERLQAAVLERFGDRVTAIFSSSRLLEIFDKTAGKGNALRMVSQMLGVDPAETAAAGDAQNDISMLEQAGLAIAMANAEEAVKAAADYVTAADNDHDGLAEAIEKYFL